MNRIINIIGQASVVFAIIVGVWCAVSAYAQWAHGRHCQGRTTGHCGWAWCQHYNASDRLHDFGF